MAKTQEELDELKKECETLGNKLKELSEEELEQITGGDLQGMMDFFKKIGKGITDIAKPILPIISATVAKEEILGGDINIKGGLIDDDKKL